MKKNIFSIIILLIALMLTSCVTKKKYSELENAHKQCDEENIRLKQENIQLAAENDDLKVRTLFLENQNAILARDTSYLGQELRDIRAKYEVVNKSYDELLAMYQKNVSSNTKELQKLLAELQKIQEDNQLKEDMLNKTSRELEQRKSELADKERRLSELQSILDRKDSVVRALKNAVLEALTGFVNKGLTVEQKNGKVYVRMDEKLLFSSGSFEVAANGIEALKNLAKVLETNPDINIMIEGHTDNVPYKASSGQISDNWDLSVMRATAVVKILLKNSSIDPGRLTAAGRSQYQPVDAANTTEARSKNRRTEIILTPKLDELFKILDSD